MPRQHCPACGVTSYVAASYLAAPHCPVCEAALSAAKPPSARGPLFSTGWATISPVAGQLS